MVSVSFEFSPPYNPTGARTLDQCAHYLTGFKHNFISVNFGGGLVPKERALQTLLHLSKKFNSQIVAHLICTGASKTELSTLALRLKHINMHKIFVMYGNPNLLMKALDQDHYASIYDMLDSLSKIAPFHYIVAGYPEGHPLGKGHHYSIDDIKEKIDAGAKEIITQFCFDNEKILRFRDMLHKNGIHVPLRIGMLALYPLQKISNLATQYNIALPQKASQDIFDLVRLNADNKTIQKMIAMHAMITQCKELIENGLDAFHFYTMNRYKILFSICKMLEIEYKVTEKTEISL